MWSTWSKSAVPSTVLVNNGLRIATATVTTTAYFPADWVNHPPRGRYSAFTPSTFPGSTGLIGYLELWDPEDGSPCGCQHTKSVTVTGDCESRVAYDCYCVGSDGGTEIWRTKSSGSCTLTTTLADSQGLTSTFLTVVPYGAPLVAVMDYLHFWPHPRNPSCRGATTQ